MAKGPVIEFQVKTSDGVFTAVWATTANKAMDQMTKILADTGRDDVKVVSASRLITS